MIPIVIVILSVALDQISKYIVAANMELGESFSAVKYILNITYTTNTGAAFGILKDHRWVFLTSSVIAIIAMIVVLIYFIIKKEHFMMQAALALMLSGGIGNMIDRLSRGYVVDFFEFDFIHFAIFNVADSCITIGSAIFIVFIFISAKKGVLFADGEDKDDVDFEDNIGESDAEYKKQDITTDEN